MRIPSLVSVEWLARAITAKNPDRHLKIVYSAVKEENIDFVQQRIPGALYFNIDECSDKTNSRLPLMLPEEKRFSDYVQNLGMMKKSYSFRDFLLRWIP